jgi:hypothetical protein
LNSLSAFAGGVLEQASSRLRLEHAPAADKSGLKSQRRTPPLPRRLQGADTSHRLTKQFVALTPMELGQEIFIVTRRRLFVVFQPKQLCDFVIHFTAKYWFVRHLVIALWNFCAADSFEAGPSTTVRRNTDEVT